MAATLQAGRGEWSLRWLRNLRWTAVAGQTATVCFVVWVLGLRLPLALVFPVIALTGISNAILHWVPAARWERPGPVTGLLVFDVLLLTALLHVSGGPHNPFTFFYLVHVALAAVVLPAASRASGTAATSIRRWASSSVRPDIEPVEMEWSPPILRANALSSAASKFFL